MINNMMKMKQDDLVESQLVAGLNYIVRDI